MVLVSQVVRVTGCDPVYVGSNPTHHPKNLKFVKRRVKMFDFMGILENPLFEYVRDRKRRKVGIVVSGTFEGKVCIGWSLCNTSYGDKFDAFKAFEISEGRALENNRYDQQFFSADVDTESDESPIVFADIVPKTVLNYIPKFMSRVVRYYKDAVYSDVANFFLSVYHDYQIAEEEKKEKLLKNNTLK